ncbi:MAG: hypothetical protein IIY81_12330, partial [Lachnospiraceae bacterium]|nr:hypothetical protein [Lachnospiraceae bacterium]
GGSFVLTILICLSTVFLKQHSCVDGFCGLGLAIILYTIVYRINIEKLFSTFLELKKDKTEAKIKNKKFNF